MKIDPGNIRTAKQAEAYKKAMTFKAGMDDMLGKMMDMDDKVDIDFNSRERGFVAVADQPIGPEGEKVTGAMKFNPETGDCEKLDAGKYSYEVKTGFFGGDEKEVYKYKDGNMFLDSYSKLQKLVINRRTGVMNYKEEEYYDTGMI